ncbi:MAG: glycosyltransferase family 39 protein [Polyangiaceae bacterium]
MASLTHARRSLVVWLRRAGGSADYLLVAAAALYLWRFSEWRVTDDDEGVYLLAGQRVMHGELPYVHFPFPQLPLTPYLYGAAQALLGRSMSAGRVLAWLMASLTLGLVFWVARKHSGRLAGAAALVLLVANPLCSLWLTPAKSLAPALFFAMAASAVTLDGTSNSRRAVGGALLGLSILCRATFLPLALPLAWFAASADGASGGRLRRAGIFASGLAGGCSPALLLAMISPGRFWFDNVTFHTLYPGGSRGWYYVRSALSELFGLGTLGSPYSIQNSLLAALVVGCVLGCSGLPAVARRYLGLGGIAALSAFIPVRPHAQYFVVALPFLAVGCAIALARSTKPLLAGATLLCIPTAISFSMSYAALDSPHRPAKEDEVAKAIDALAAGARVSSSQPSYLVASRSPRVRAADSQFTRIVGSRVSAVERERYQLLTDAELLSPADSEGRPEVFASGSLTSPQIYYGLQVGGWKQTKTVNGVLLWTRRSAPGRTDVQR